MRREVKKYLFDISMRIARIDAHIGSPKLFSIYENDLMLQAAIERNIEL